MSNLRTDARTWLASSDVETLRIREEGGTLPVALSADDGAPAWDDALDRGSRAARELNTGAVYVDRLANQVDAVEDERAAAVRALLDLRKRPTAEDASPDFPPCWCAIHPYWALANTGEGPGAWWRSHSPKCQAARKATGYQPDAIGDRERELVDNAAAAREALGARTALELADEPARVSEAL